MNMTIIFFQKLLVCHSFSSLYLAAKVIRNCQSIASCIQELTYENFDEYLFFIIINELFSDWLDEADKIFGDFSCNIVETGILSIYSIKIYRRRKEWVKIDWLTNEQYYLYEQTDEKKRKEITGKSPSWWGYLSPIVFL